MRLALWAAFVAAVPVGDMPAKDVECDGDYARSYTDLASVLRDPQLQLDTVPVAGTVELTVTIQTAGPTRSVTFGKPSDGTIATARGVCRVAALLTSRGDSVAVTWLVDPATVVLGVVALSRPLTLADRPTPVASTTLARIRDRSLYDRLKAAAISSAAGRTGTGQTTVVTLINEAGVPVLSRLSRSSGVRVLDESALRIMATVLTSTPDSIGVRKAVWYVTPIDW